MAPEPTPNEWPPALARCWIDSAQVLKAESDEQEKPGLDSLGNPGSVRVVRHGGKFGLDWPKSRVVQRLEQAGLRPTRATAEETELQEMREKTGGAEDPFLLERSVVATVRGREFPGQQRSIVEAKVAALRKELADSAIAPARRTAATTILAELLAGLSTTVDVRAVVRRFRPHVVVRDPVNSLGTVVRLAPGSRIVYDVRPAKPEPGDEAESGPMVFHVLALGGREAVLLYTGGVHGTRHLRDLEESRIHHAWFANRERVKTDATAPWIGRAVYRELASRGSSDLIVHRRRDEEPIAVQRMREGKLKLRVDGQIAEVPVFECMSARGDEMIVLADAANPLLLVLREAGAELVRTVVSVDSAGR